MNRLTTIILAFFFFLSGCLPPNLPKQPVSTSSPALPATLEQVTRRAAEARQIALIGLDGNIWLTDVDSGEKKQITQDGTPKVTSNPAPHRVYYCCSSWSSDGKRLAFRGVVQNDTQNGTDWQFNIVVYDVERGESRLMPQKAPVSSLAFRPGTHLLAYDEVLDPNYFVNGEPDASKARGIYGLNVDTGETSELVEPAHGLWLSAPRWSEDGNTLGFVEQTVFESSAPFGIYDFQNKVYGAWNQVIGEYAFAPDGQHIAYDRLPIDGFSGNERIWVSDPWGKDEQLLSPQAGPAAHGPVWSPKGDLLAYKLGDPEQAPAHSGNVLVVQPASAGAEARQLGSIAFSGALAWSPDGTRLVYSTGPYEQPQIKVVTVADGSIKDLGNGYDPIWQPSAGQHN